MSCLAVVWTLRCGPCIATFLRLVCIQVYRLSTWSQLQWHGTNAPERPAHAVERECPVSAA